MRPDVTLRPAMVGDAKLLAVWDRDPQVAASEQDDLSTYVAYSEDDWNALLRTGEPGNTFLIAEADSVPVGVIQIVEPAKEVDSDWGDGFPARMRGLHIWIGAKDHRGRGLGTQMMVEALAGVFADPAVNGVLIDPLASNTGAHAFNRRLGFTDVEYRIQRESHCLIMQMNRADWRVPLTPKETPQ